MPDDLKKQIIEAIAASGDDNYKRLLMLLLRVEDIFIERVAELADQMTVPAAQHAEDHNWISATRRVEGGFKSAALKIVVSVLEKGTIFAAGAAAVKFF